MDYQQPTQQPVQQPVQPPEQKIKKVKNIFKITTVIFIIISLALSGYIVFQYISQASKSNSNNNQNNNVENVSKTELDKDASVRSVIDSIKKDIEDAMLIKHENGGSEQFISYNKAYDANFPIYKSDSAKTGMPLEKSYEISKYFIQPETDATKEKLTNTAKNVLSSMGFVEYKDANTEDGYLPLAPMSAQYINKSTGVLCAISQAVSYITCGNTSWLSEEYVSLLNNLAEAYKEKQKSYPIFIMRNKAEIKNSTVSPYQTITVVFGNAAQLFYRASNTSKWVYFTATQNTIGCDRYNTQDLKNAYASDTCYDSSLKTTRKVQE